MKEPDEESNIGSYGKETVCGIAWSVCHDSDEVPSRGRKMTWRGVGVAAMTCTPPRPERWRVGGGQREERGELSCGHLGRNGPLALQLRLVLLERLLSAALQILALVVLGHTMLSKEGGRY